MLYFTFVYEYVDRIKVYAKTIFPNVFCDETIFPYVVRIN